MIWSWSFEHRGGLQKKRPGDQVPGLGTSRQTLGKGKRAGSVPGVSGAACQENSYTAENYNVLHSRRRSGQLECRAMPASARRKVLVVDDVADSAESFAALLRVLGHEPRCVTDARVAVAAALEMTPDVAFLDIGMPHVNGYQLAASLREKFGAKLCLVALTAYGSAADREMSRGAGFDAHLVKPADLEMIQTVLKDLLR